MALHKKMLKDKKKKLRRRVKTLIQKSKNVFPFVRSPTTSCILLNNLWPKINGIANGSVVTYIASATVNMFRGVLESTINEYDANFFSFLHKINHKETENLLAI